MLIIKNFVAGINGKEILHGIDMEIKPGEVHAVMGPNGSGKTTLAMSLMGHPSYKFPISPVIAESSVSRDNFQFSINNVPMIDKSPEERAKHGLFASFQAPVEITGVSLLAFLRTATKAMHPDVKKPLSVFKEEVKNALRTVSLDESFMQRSVNEGFSGGERKRAEIAQLLVLKPQYAILDEIDSGLDVDSLKVVAKAVRVAAEEQNMGILIITHYQRILHFLKPDRVHVLMQGKIKKSGSLDLVRLIEEEGYAAI